MKRPMNAMWRRRCGTVVVLWAGGTAALGLAGLHPRAAVLAAVALAVAATLWLMLDLADRTTSVDWRPSGERGSTQYGNDGRMRAVHRQLDDQRRFGADPRLHAHLVDLIDERLSALHGIDRATDPSRASALLGAELTDFITATPLDAGITDPARLELILTHIEAIGTEANP